MQNRVTRQLIFAIAFAAIGMGALPQTQTVTAQTDPTGYIYWVGSGPEKIQRAHLDGSNVETLLHGISHPLNLAYDPDNQKVYWTDPYGIKRANTDGSDTEALIDFVFPYDIALDLPAGKMYWSGGRTISRANLDGSNIEDIIAVSSAFPPDLDLDLNNEKIYWTEDDFFSESRLMRANLDGSGIESITSQSKNPVAMALDPTNEKIYWTERNSSGSRLMRANLDGSDIEMIVDGPLGVDYITVDPIGDKLYWTTGTDLDGDGEYEPSIVRANLDGSEVEPFVIVSYYTVGGMIVDHVNNKFYWANAQFTQPGLWSVDLTDGSNIHPLVTDGFNNYTDIEIDRVNHQIYWLKRTIAPYGESFSSSPGKIQRANLDASGIEDVVTELVISDFALNPIENELYWINSDENKIQKSDLDGSNVQDVVVDIPVGSGQSIDSMTLNPNGQKLYWLTGNSVWRSNFDGTGMEQIRSSGVSGDLKFDVENEQLYWESRWESITIRVPSINRRYRIEEGKWSSGFPPEPDTVYMSDFNRSNETEIATGSIDIHNIAVYVGNVVDAYCQSITVKLNLDNAGSITPQQINDNSVGVGGITSLALDINTFNADDLGTTVPVTLTVTDGNNNSGNCTADVFVSSVLDVNGDGIVSPSDANYTLNRLGTDDSDANVDGIGLVTEDDFRAVLEAIGTIIVIE